MAEPEPWDARTAGAALLADVTRAITDERAKAADEHRPLRDADLARAVLRSPALKEANRKILDGLLDGLEAEYQPKIAAMILGGAGQIIEEAAPAIRAAVAGEIASAIEQSVCAPGDQCTERFCPDCTRYRQCREDAATARRIGGTP